MVLGEIERDGYVSKQTGPSLSLFGFFNHIWIVGNNEINEAFIIIYYNDDLKDSADTKNSRTLYSDNVLLFESMNSALYTYTFKIENNQGKDARKYL